MTRCDDVVMSGSPESILFLGGAGLPAWIWDEVRRDLHEARDTRVASRPASVQARLEEYVDAALESAPEGDFAVVAHSGGGVIGAEIVRRAPERAQAFLGLSAVIPRPGGSFISAMPVPNRWALSAVMRFAGTRPPDSAIRRGLASGLDDRVTDRIIADFTPESPGYYRDRTGHGPWASWCGYVHATADRELPLALQRRSAGRLGAAWKDDLNTGHLPMIEDPSAVARLIIRFLEARS